MNEQIDYLKKYLSIDQWPEAIKRLKTGEPVQYIIGNVSFMGYPIKVDKRVLIPRFETETLVDKTINYAQNLFSKKINILDLGTGSGCIAIALKKKLAATILALDISQDALDLAKENALNNNVSINFKKGDMTKAIKGKFDLIISNPPYIPLDGYVQDIVKNNEPAIALFAQDNGLYFYKKILAYAFQILNSPGLIAFEIGDNEKNLLEGYLKENFSNIRYSFEKDLNGLIRYLFIFN